MKSKMRITGNRTMIGIICIVLALGITFGIAPLVNRFTDRKVEVVQVKLLLYFLNKEWYGALMYTTFGKVTLAICGAVMLFTFLRMQKYCEPVEYRR